MQLAEDPISPSQGSPPPQAVVHAALEVQSFFQNRGVGGGLEGWNFS